MVSRLVGKSAAVEHKIIFNYSYLTGSHGSQDLLEIKTEVILS